MKIPHADLIERLHRATGDADTAQLLEAAANRLQELADRLRQEEIMGQVLQAAQGERHLQWTAPASPNKECSYDHVTAKTPFGRILITWKGWKDYPSPTVDEHPVPDYFYAGNNLDDAKAQAEKAYFEAIDSMPY